jgi:hypothetical protein
VWGRGDGCDYFWSKVLSIVRFQAEVPLVFIWFNFPVSCNDLIV